MVVTPAFWCGKRVLVTGHTGFKGSWLCRALTRLGASVYGYALEPDSSGGYPGLFALSGMDRNEFFQGDFRGDIRDIGALGSAFTAARPEVVFHLAAQPLVREGYTHPVTTYAVNVMGAVNLMECVRQTESVRSVVNVTTDKVYLNEERQNGYQETDRLGGIDPYADSKACAEGVTRTYIRSYFAGRNIAVSTVRSGNVIGGGDFAADRIIPDCIRAVHSRQPIAVRNPNSTRPYLHVLDTLAAYLLIAEAQYTKQSFAGAYNIGPAEWTATGDLVELFCRQWGDGARWHTGNQGGPHEANLLHLDTRKIRNTLGWRPVWSIEDAVAKTVAWTKAFSTGEDVGRVMDTQLSEVFAI